MIQIDASQVRQLESDLKTFKLRAYPFATKETINRTAKAGRKIARDIAKGRFILRNTWTRRSIQVEMARTLNVSRQYATLGSTADYMETQEFGGNKPPLGRWGTPIPTPAASGESSLPRRRLPKRVNKLSSIALGRSRTRVLNRKARNRAAVMEAASKGGTGFVFLELGRRAGIYRVSGGTDRPRLTKIWDMSKRIITIPRRPWLLPATNKAIPLMPRYYRDALIAQLRRHNVLGY